MPGGLRAKLAALPGRVRIVLAVLSGIFLALAQAPFGLWPLGLVGLVAIFALARASAHPGWLGQAFGTAYFAVSMFWITEPFMVDAARHAWMAPFGLVFMAGGLALFWMAAFRLAHWLGGGGLALATLLGLAELARGYVLTGFPWALIGYFWIDTPVMQVAAWSGAFGLTFLTLIAAAALSRALIAPGSGVGMRFALVLPLAALFAAGLLREFPAPTGPADDAPIVRIVQPNAEQHLKWQPEWLPVFFERQLALTAQVTDKVPDLVIWPEAATGYDISPGTPVREMILDASGGAPVILGHLRWTETGTFNALSVVAERDRAGPSYDKHHLVPFGEYIPLGDWLLQFGINGLAANPGAAFSAGPGPKVLAAGDGLGRFLPLICYEAVFPQDTRARGDRPDWLLHLTNDAWFGSHAGPYQHLAQVKMRAVEQGLPVLRAANTGISAVIDPRGHVLDQLPLGQTGFIDAPLPAPLDATIYAHTGDWPVLVLLLTLLGGLAARRRQISS